MNVENDVYVLKLQNLFDYRYRIHIECGNISYMETSLE